MMMCRRSNQATGTNGTTRRRAHKPTERIRGDGTQQTPDGRPSSWIPTGYRVNSRYPEWQRKPAWRRDRPLSPPDTVRKNGQHNQFLRCEAMSNSSRLTGYPSRLPIAQTQAPCGLIQAIQVNGLSRVRVRVSYNFLPVNLDNLDESALPQCLRPNGVTSRFDNPVSGAAA